MVGSIIEDLPFEEYKAAPGINASLLKVADSMSMAHVQATMKGIRDPESDAMDFGKCFHSLLLENREDFIEHPATYPGEKKADAKWNWNANFCKEWEKENATAKDKVAMSAAEVMNLRGMVAVLQKVPDLQPFLNGRRELSVFAEKDGLPIKCRIDLLPNDGPVIDFKSTANANPENFLRTAFDKGYHIQAAWNLDCLRRVEIVRKSFWCVAVEPNPPHAHCILKFDDTCLSFLRFGRIRATAAFQRIKNCMNSGEWPAYGTHAAEVHAKPYMLPMLDLTA